MITYKMPISLQAPRQFVSDMEFVTGDVNAYKVECTFYDNGKVLPLDGNAFSVRARRADGKVYFSGGSVVDNKAVFVPQNTLYAVPGDLVLEFALYDEEGSFVTTGIVTARVVEGIGNKGAAAETEVSVYVSLLSDMQATLRQAQALLEQSGLEISEELSRKADVDGVIPVKQIEESDIDTATQKGIYYVMTSGLKTPYLLFSETNISDFSTKQIRVGADASVSFRTYKSGVWSNWETYVTSGDFADYQASVEMALDEIVALQNVYIGG